jgi:hypothetical protein
MTRSSPPALEHAFDYVARLKPPVWFGEGPSGTRMFREIAGGTVEGPLLRGEVLSGGGDWATIGADGFLRLDVRAQMRTGDGAHVYVQYDGVLELNEPVVTADSSDGGETAFDDQYWRTAPRFETGDERYVWLTQATFVARGRIHPEGVAYEVFVVR